MRNRFFGERWSRWVQAGIPVGRVFGIPVSVHLFLVIVLAYWFLLAALSPAPAAQLLATALSAGILFGSVLLHELGHCYGAKLVGGESRGILLWPLGGIASISGSEKTPQDEFVVVILGPLVSLALAAAGGALYWAMPERWAMTAAGGVAEAAFYYLGTINAMLFLFNMAVPLFPMDCARILRALFSTKFEARQVTYHLCLAGFFVAGILIGLYLAGATGASAEGAQLSVLIFLVAAFGALTCWTELKALEFSEIYTETWNCATSPGAAAGHLFKLLFGSRRRPRRREPAKIIIAYPQELAGPEREREELETELDQAVKDEDFVRAAEIRDRLRNMIPESPPR